ncbi:DUF4214 domain-containing protein [Undibacterium sp. JH2W]|uniref:DUF4214 domain-containing protein n=1 Tax=Undibacterium sp. JH2W TaxID=3413037 RepID=UPI003BEFCADD
MGINAGAIQKLYIAYFNRPADTTGLAYWQGQLDANKISLAGIAQSFSVQREYQDVYFGKNTLDVVTALYKNLLGRNPDAAGLAYWTEQIENKVVNIGTAALAIVNGVTSGSADEQMIAAKLRFATAFTSVLDTPEKQASYLDPDALDAMKVLMSTVKPGVDMPALQIPAYPKILPIKSLVFDTVTTVDSLKNGASLDQETIGAHVYLTALPWAAKTAVLQIGNKNIAIDSTISKSDTSLDFSFPRISKYSSNMGKILLMDASGNILSSSESFDLLKPEYKHTGPNAAVNFHVITTGGNVVAGKVNTSNTGLFAEASLDISQLAGGRVELKYSDNLSDFNTLATKNITSTSDGNIKFDLSNMGSSLLQKIMSRDAAFYLRVIDSSGQVTQVSSEKFLHDYLPPTIPGKASIVTLQNGGSEIAVNITAGQVNGGKAYLLLDGNVVATDSQIAANDGDVRFALDVNSATSLLSGINTGRTQIKLFDASGNSVTENLQNLSISKNPASPGNDITPPQAASVSPFTIVRVPEPSIGFSFEEGTKAILKFSEPTTKEITLRNILVTDVFDNYPVEAYFGSGAKGTWNAAGDQFTITLGSYSLVAFSLTHLTLLGVKDLAGNVADISFN